MNISKNLRASFLLSALLFASCGIINNLTTRNWHGGDVGGHNYATFDEMNGRQDFKLLNPASGDFTLKYTSEVTEGELRLVITQGHNTIVNRDLTGSVRDSVRIGNGGNPDVKISITGKHARGKYDITYPTSK
ncbi:hypothetical protein [Mucilaginibacter sp.]|jgi:hypothetical protein|uniref:hypothetical protein n=1 Tax=Mucilaginibacter sp. TaxID=1882438 RepID=UPI002BF97E2E|nr:hypothetical protein [Mucilaginibacter sp.]HTI59720.1 hypothetical protein [Mucilaginibacter sp.]